MTDTITPEERARIRAIASNTSMLSHRDGIHDILTNLLNALEAAEADTVMLFDEAVRQKKRAIEAEAENARLQKMVEWLAAMLDTACPKSSYDVLLRNRARHVAAGTPSQREFWQEAARRAVAGEGEQS